MGVLDEAIRDHLDLRRRHGASEAEISRAEAEALGPARRDPAAGLFSDEEAAAGDDQTTILDPVVEEEHGRADEDSAPSATAPEVDHDSPTALYDLEQEFDDATRAEDAAVEGPSIADAPVDEPPVVGAPHVDEPPVEDEPPAGDAPQGHQARPVPPRPLDEPEDESEPPPPAFPRPYNEP